MEVSYTIARFWAVIARIIAPSMQVNQPRELQKLALHSCNKRKSRGIDLNATMDRSSAKS